MFDLVLKIFLLLSPIFIIPFNGLAARYQFYQFGYFSSNLNLLQLQFFQYGTILLFLTALFKKPEREFKDKYVGLLLSVCIWSVFLHPKTIQNFSNVFLGFLLYFLVVSYASNIRNILKVVVVISALNTAFAILQTCGVYLIYSPKQNIDYGIFGLMSYKSHLGIYQALALPICYALNPLLSIIPLVGLLLSKSLTAIIPAVLGMAYLLKKKIFKINFSLIYFLAFTTLIVSFCIKFSYKLIPRFEVWGVIIKQILNKVFYGYGVGIFKYIAPAGSTNIEYTETYNLYLKIFHALGILGIVSLFLFIKGKLSRLKDNDLITQGLFSSCLILALCGLGYSFIDYPRLAGTAIVLFGLLTITKEVKYEN